MDSENMSIYEKIEKFTELSKDELFSLKDELALDIPFEKLILCQGYHRVLSRVPISLSRLRIYDALCGSAQKAEDIIISEVRSESKIFMSTLTDLYAKLKAMKIAKESDTSLKDIVSVSEKYFERIGVSPVSSASNTKNIQMTDDTVFILVQGNAISEQGTDKAYKNFRDNSFFVENVIGDSPVCEKGILKTLSSLSSGIFIDIDALCETQSEDYLSCLVEYTKSSYIAVAPRSSAEELVSIAKSYSLVAKCFANALATDQIIIRHAGENSMLIIPFERSIPTKRINLTLTGHKYSNNTYSYSSELYDRNTNAIALTAERSGFFEAMDTVIDSILYLAALGIDRRDMTLTLRFDIPTSNELEHEEVLSDALSSVLGAYRAMIELAVGDKNSSLSSSDNDNTVCCIARSNKEAIKIGAKFLTAGNGVYFVGIKRPEFIYNDYLPDFDLLRKICDRIPPLVKEGKISSIKVFNGRIADALSQMGIDSLKLIQASDTSVYGSYAQGFIVESPFEVSSIKLGTLINNTDETL